MSVHPTHGTTQHHSASIRVVYCCCRSFQPPCQRRSLRSLAVSLPLPAPYLHAVALQTKRLGAPTTQLGCKPWPSRCCMHCYHMLRSCGVVVKAVLFLVIDNTKTRRSLLPPGALLYAQTLSSKYGRIYMMHPSSRASRASTLLQCTIPRTK